MGTLDKTRISISSAKVSSTPIGRLPPVGDVPETMTAAVIRQGDLVTRARRFSRRKSIFPGLAPMRCSLV